MNSATDLNAATATATTAPVAIEPASYEPTGILYAGEENRTSLFVEYFRTLARYRWLIVCLAIGGVVASFLINFTALPVYRARTSLDIQSLNSDFMNMRAVAPTGQSDDASSDVYVQTQIKLLQSDTLLQRTVDRLKAEPHPDTIDQMDLASRIERATYLVRDKKISYDALVDDTAKRVAVKPIGVTRLVEITCDSWSADFSAEFCNTLVDEFKTSDLEMRRKESESTSEYLTKQVADVKTKAEQSEKELEAATGGNGLVLSQESTGVEQDKLRDIQGQYVIAQADRIQKEASLGGAAGSGSGPELNQSPAYQHYAQNLADLQSEVAKLVPPLTEDNPKVIHLRSEIKAVQDQMAAERSSNATHIKSDYEQALHREALLAAQYHREESVVSSDLGKASKISLLRRDVESEQQLYQTLLQLAREAGFASAMHASTIRVVDAATPSKIPFSPQRKSAALSGLLVGTLFGVGLAFAIDRSSTVFRLPGDVERYLGVRELGVIPSSIRGQRLVSSPAGPGLGEGSAVPKGAQNAFSNWTENFSIVAEAYRNATTSIMLSEHPREQGRVYVLSSPNAGEGKTTVTSNLGVALSKSRLRVLLIDGDLRKPALHRVLQVPNEFGFRNLLRGETGPTPDEVAPLYQPTALPNLFVLPAGTGTEEVVELLHSTQTGEVIKRLRSEFDVVIIDTPPMLHMADTRILASHAQGAILVVRAAKTTRDQASKARDLFDQDRVRLVGTILNDFNPSKNGLAGYYKSYYRYMEEIVSEPSATSSWLDGLFARGDTRAIERTSSNGEYEEVAEIDIDGLAAAAGGETHNGSSNGTGPKVTIHRRPQYRPKRNEAQADPHEVSVSQFFMRLFKGDAPAPETVVPIEVPRLGEGEIEPGDLYAERTHERRKNRRKEFPDLVAYYWDGAAPLAHDIRDISATGLYLMTEERWYPGTQVMILLQRQDAAENDPDRSITVNAQVVRFGTDGLGFAFVMPEKNAKRTGETFGAGGADRGAFHRFLQRMPWSNEL